MAKIRDIQKAEEATIDRLSRKEAVDDALNACEVAIREYYDACSSGDEVRIEAAEEWLLLAFEANQPVGLISREELARIRKMATDFITPPTPRTGYETMALHDRLQDAVMDNLQGILEAAERGVKQS